MYYVYILKGSKYYVGYTTDLERRLDEHKKGWTKTTREIGNWNLTGWFECKTKTDAISLERKIKKSGHINRWITKDDFVLV